MCGRYYLLDNAEDEHLTAILQELNRSGQPEAADFHPGEIFPAGIAPVIVAKPGGSTVRAMRWGFPRAGGGGMVINSRSEKADVTPMFSKAVRERRCLVPVTGFYEWRRTPGGSKTKDRFSFQAAQAAEQHRPTYLAGVYGEFSGGFAKGGYDGFAILTQPADPQMQPYHQRMPVILQGDAARKAWLFAPPEHPYQQLRGLFAPPPLAIHPA